ncbi:hypothetical protein, partial [Curtobacterium sp. 'Ferrero']|uniref:hypothetical protein n=1 Tax=Curtobacterium sp. 'Ferrero' TaxID=2033654 RepID=UPI001C3EFB33
MVEPGAPPPALRAHNRESDSSLRSGSTTLSLSRQRRAPGHQHCRFRSRLAQPAGAEAAPRAAARPRAPP